MGAAAGLLAALLLLAGLVISLVTGPAGDPSPPNVNDAQFYPAFLQANLSSARIVILFQSLGIALFLWFLAALWRDLREAEGLESRGATAALLGGVGGSVLTLSGIALLATAGLSTSPAQADVVPALYVAAALLTALGMGVFSIFFFAVAKVIHETGALNRWLGWLAFAVGLLAVCGFMTPFFAANVLNAATGLLGHWLGSGGFVLWLALASAALTLAQRRDNRSPADRTAQAADGGKA